MADFKKPTPTQQFWAIGIPVLLAFVLFMVGKNIGTKQAAEEVQPQMMVDERVMLLRGAKETCGGEVESAETYEKNGAFHIKFECSKKDNVIVE